MSGSIVATRQPTLAQLSWFHVYGSGQCGQFSFVARNGRLHFGQSFIATGKE